MTDTSSLAIVLAAGMGTRMKSALPKVLHPIAGVPMIAHAMETARGVGFERTAVVVGPDMQAVEAAVRSTAAAAQVFVQHERLGTAHAVLAARPALEDFRGDVVVLFGDTPLLRPETLQAARAALREGADLVVLGFEAGDPTGYGRLITNGAGRLMAIREERDASDAERAITLCNSGVFAFRGGIVLSLLDRIGCDNAKGEYYLTDAVELARTDGLEAVAVACPEDEVLGVNSRAELARVPRPSCKGRLAPGRHGRRGHLGRAGDRLPQPRHARSAATWSSSRTS